MDRLLSRRECRSAVVLRLVYAREAVVAVGRARSVGSVDVERVYDRPCRWNNDQ